MRKKPYTGQDIVNNPEWGIRDFQLFNLLNAGVQAFTNTGKKVVDRDPLLKKRYTLEYLKEKEWNLELLERGTDSTGKVIVKGQGHYTDRKKLERIDTDKIALRKWEKQPKTFFEDPEGCESIGFTLPDDDRMRWSAIFRAKTFRYVAADVDKFFDNEYNQSHPLPSEEIQSEIGHQQDTAPAPAVPPVPVKTSAVNFFTRVNRGNWRIGFDGQEAPIQDLLGLQYIGYLLEKPGTSISCRDLYQAASGKTPVKIMSEGAAISEGLNVGSSKQVISDPKAKDKYISKYKELENDLLKINDLPDWERTPQHEMLKKEIENEQAEILPHLKERNFADPNDIKAQSNMRKRLDTAYEAISKADMKKMAKHLQDHIKPDDAYGLIYTGGLTWDITR